MKPIAVVQHVANDGPSYFATWCGLNNIPLTIFCIFRGDILPASLEDFSGLCILGGPMSANDDMDYYPQLFSLIREAVSIKKPIIGHCLGGQLMSIAMGGTVQASEHAEIGWSTLESTDDSLAKEWFGNAKVSLFQWHSDSFSIPPGAKQVLTGKHCRNQAYVIDEIHLGMQFHCEVDEGKIRDWLIEGHQEISDSTSPGIQKIDMILPTLQRNVESSQHIAGHIYKRWSMSLNLGAL